MPLIVHPSSTCDVCLELYSWSTSSDDNCKPYAISCGHVFCFGCLQRMQPSTCPLCRKAFLPDRVKKLHIDRPPTFSENNDSVRVNELLQQVALVSGENTEEDEVMSVISEAQQWLATREDRNHIVYKPLRIAVAALHRYTVTQKETLSIREAKEQQEEEFRKRMHLKDQDLQVSRHIEMNLVDRIQRLEDEYKTKLTHAEKTMAETDTELAQLRAEHANFRAQLARYQNRENPLPAPPQSFAGDRPLTFVRSPGSSSGFVIHPVVPPSIDANPYGGYRSSTVRAPVRPLTEVQNMSTIREVDSFEPQAPRKASRTAGIIPGAPASQKVVPPPPVQLPISTNAGYIDSAPVVENIVTDRRSERSDRTPRGDTMQAFVRTPSYGYVIGGGYVPLREPSVAAASQVEEHSAVGQLMLYTESEQAPFSSDNQPRTVEAAARALALSSGEIETAETTWGHVQNALRHSIPWNESTSSLATTVATSIRTNAMSDASGSTSASASLSNLGILAGTASRDLGRPAVALNGVSPHDITGSVRSSPEPSLVSTWGTVPSTRSSRSVSLRDLDLTGFPSTVDLTAELSEAPSHNPSLADLNLMNLPSMRSHVSLDAISTAPGQEDTVEARPETPRALPWHANEPGPTAIPPAQEDLGRPPATEQGSFASPIVDQVTYANHFSEHPGGLGLTLSTSGGTVVTGQEDLDQVSESLRQLLREERHRVSRRRHSRHASLSTVEDQSQSRTHERDDISDHLSSVRSTAFVRSLSQTSPQYDGAIYARQQGLAVAGTIGPDHNVHHRRRHSSVAVPSQSTASSTPQHRNIGAHRIQQAQSENREAQAASSVTSLGPQGYASRDDPSSPLGIAATQSRDTLVGGSSLLLSFAPPSTSTAATSSGEPTAIHAPRPVDRRHTSGMFSFLRNRR